MSIFGLVFFMILTLLLAYYIAVNIYRFFKDKKNMVVKQNSCQKILLIHNEYLLRNLRKIY
ncbi:hypothetical protein [Spiroplasma endosymbiont of Asaphidion curtum]|uniref:hypothetical protein n=1 Tax=Spiroplasma endosymbiont of Asaphidion curtum TaxID=3066281 RepID=UPI00313AE849